MKKPDLPYLDPRTVNGKVYYYFRRGNLRVRLPDDPDTEEFSQSYWMIRNGKINSQAKTTWDKLVESYLASPAFKSLGKGTRANYRRHLDDIRAKNGKLDVRNFRRKHAIATRDALQRTWSKANERIAVLSALCNHAVDLEWIERNPVVKIAKLQGGEYEPWPENMLQSYERFTDSHDGLDVARTIYELAIGTGQRLGDCIAMKWSDFDGEFMRVVQEKTDTKLEVYVPARLKAYLLALPRSGDHILAKNLRRPLSKSQVQKAVDKVREPIGAKAQRLVIHGWRYTAAKELADAGVAIQDIQAVLGHKTLTMAQKYTSQRDQRVASKRAQTARERNEDRT